MEGQVDWTPILKMFYGLKVIFISLRFDRLLHRNPKNTFCIRMYLCGIVVCGKDEEDQLSCFLFLFLFFFIKAFIEAEVLTLKWKN